LVGSLIEFFGQVDGARFLKGGRRDMYSRGKLRMDLDLEPALTHGN